MWFPLDYHNASFKDFRWEKRRERGGQIFLDMKHSLERYTKS